jgi:DNA-binding NarL/FixJ family response regulator
VTAVVRVLLADDQALVRAGFKLLLEVEDGIEVVGEAADGAEAVELAERVLPDVVVMDIRMPVVDGIEATRRIAASPALAGTRVLILTTYDLDDYVYEALRAGASGFVVKDTPPVELLRAIRVVAEGEALLDPRVTRRLIAEVTATRPQPRVPASRLDVLTPRELQVMTLVAEGLGNEEIAAQLGSSPATVRTHVSRAMTKLNVRDRAQLVVLAYQTHLVSG